MPSAASRRRRCMSCWRERSLEYLPWCCREISPSYCQHQRNLRSLGFRLHRPGLPWSKRPHDMSLVAVLEEHAWLRPWVPSLPSWLCGTRLCRLYRPRSCAVGLGLPHYIRPCHRPLRHLFLKHVDLVSYNSSSLSWLTIGLSMLSISLLILPSISFPSFFLAPRRRNPRALLELCMMIWHLEHWK